MSKIKIIVLGDISPAWGFPEAFATGDENNVFGNLIPIFSDADLTVANLESPATESDTKLDKNSVCLKARAKDVSVLKKAGIDGVSLANNHILDYTDKAFSDTISALDENGIFYYGAGNVDVASKPYYFEKDNIKVGFLAFAEREFNCAVDYSVGANLWDDLQSPIDIKKAKENCDYLIVQYHGGIEHYIYPSPVLQKKCRAMAEAGADFVTCQHSHCIGTKEVWNGCEILYGQGNCIFGKKNKDSWNRGLIASIEIGENGGEISYFPITATDNGEALVEDIGKNQILDKLAEESKKILDNNFIKNEWEKFCLSQKDMYLPMLFCKGRVFNKLNRMSNGKLIKFATKYTGRRDVMNLIRCDAHREVVSTILENEVYDK